MLSQKDSTYWERSAASLSNAGFMSTHNDRCTYTKAILSDIRGEQLTAFLTPESCLTTAYTWEDLKRSSSIRLSLSAEWPAFRRVSRDRARP